MDRGVRGGCALLVVVALLALSGVAVGEGNEPPLADAGLDQQATAGETVRLDATGSRDPDGNVTGYDWSIEMPGGGTTTPDCGTCGTTSFRPETPGQYNVTITVTDDDGATRTDTLYVEVDPAPGPSVSLSGPTEPTVEDAGYGDPSGEATYVANFSRGGNPVDYVEWQVDGEQTVQRSINDSGVNSINYVHSMESTANHTLTVRVVDIAGREATDSVNVSPQVRTVDRGSDGGDDGYDGAMRVEYGDSYITVQAPTVDADGDIVRQSNPSGRELVNAATASPGEQVETDFSDNEDSGSGNESPKNSNNDLGGAIGSLLGDINTDATDQSNAPENEADPNEDESGGNIIDLCPIC